MLYAKLRGKLKELEIRQEQLAQMIGLDNQASISHRLTGKLPWRINEMYEIMDIIMEPYDQLHLYFPKDGKRQIATTPTIV